MLLSPYRYVIGGLMNTCNMLSLPTWSLQAVVLAVAVSSGAGDENSPCGRNLTATADLTTLVSPGYPNNYDENLDCIYHITAPEGERVFVKPSYIDGIRMEASKSCHKDYLLFISGPSTTGDIMAKACGMTYIQAVSPGRFMTIVFHSDSDTGARGFRLLYKSVNQTEKCPKQILDVSETKYVITSPQYPHNYPLDNECQWALSAPQGFEIYLEVNMSSIEKSEKCQKDYIEITDAFDKRSGWNLGTWCGNDIPQPIHSSGIFMNIAFHSDNTTSGPGFKFFYSARPKSVFTEKPDTNNVGMIVGIVVGVLAFIVIVIVVVVVVLRKRKNRNSNISHY